MDSLMAVELRNALSKAVGRRLPATLVYDYPSAGALAKHLSPDEDGDDAAGGPASSAGAPATAPAAGLGGLAIVGMSCRLPGHANDPDGFWRVLDGGVNAVKDVPHDRWNVKQYYSAEVGAPGKMYVKYFSLVDCIDQFDP
eukprot:gene884-11488_t